MRFDSNLIFDIGMHDGTDTKYYLLKGFRVVAVEANPNLVSQNQKRFSSYISGGKLYITEGAVTDGAERATLKIHAAESQWSTIFADRWSADEGQYHTVQVPRVKLADLFERYGCPYYVKIDIEGADIFALRDIISSGKRPPFISAELSSNEIISTFLSANYSRFKLIDQNQVYHKTLPRGESEEGVEGVTWPIHSPTSGPFGRELPGEWQSAEAAHSEWRRLVELSPSTEHFDLHACYDDFGLNTAA